MRSKLILNPIVHVVMILSSAFLSYGVDVDMARVVSIDVVEYSDDKGNADVFMEISGRDLVRSICEEVSESKEHDGLKVMLEPGPVLILKNAEGRIEAAFQIRLDGALEARMATLENRKYKIGAMAKFRGEKHLLQIRRPGSISKILDLWYKSHGK